MRPFEVDVSSKYGAPMGRRSDKPSDLTGKVHLARVPPCEGGDYDPGGAYWGGIVRSTPRYPTGGPLFCAWDDSGHAVYLRAPDRAAAKASVPLPPGARFYR